MSRGRYGRGSNKEIICQSKEMLNMSGNHGVAAISIDMVLEAHPQYHPYLDASIAISDCNRVINLAMYAENPEEAENALHKLNVLVKQLTEARDKLVPAVSKYCNYWILAEEKRVAEELERELAKQKDA